MRSLGRNSRERIPIYILAETLQKSKLSMKVEYEGFLKIPSQMDSRSMIFVKFTFHRLALFVNSSRSRFGKRVSLLFFPFKDAPVFSLTYP